MTQNSAAPCVLPRFRSRALSASARIFVSGIWSAERCQRRSSRTTTGNPQISWRAAPDSRAHTCLSVRGAGSEVSPAKPPYVSVRGADRLGPHTGGEVARHSEDNHGDRGDHREAGYRGYAFDVEHDRKTRHDREEMTAEQLRVETPNRSKETAGDQQHRALKDQRSPQDFREDPVAATERDPLASLPEHRQHRGDQREDCRDDDEVADLGK